MDNLKDSMTVALSWGHALQAMVYATTTDLEHTGLNLVQLVGGLSAIRNEISGQELVRELAVRLESGRAYLTGPAELVT
jgi:DNA-binding transcriptional regulator LsrR (DeoR family)